MLEISRPLDKTILSQIPAAIVVFRASDQVVVYANEMALNVSGYSTSDYGKLSLWDVLVEDHTKRAADEASKPLNKRATEDGDQSEGFARFRAKSGDESNFWFKIKDISDADGHVRFRTVLAFMNYDQHAHEEHWNDYIHKIVEMGVRRSAGTFASELNNALATLQIALESRGLLGTKDETIYKALDPIKAIGERLCRFGSGLEAPNNQPLPAANTGSTLLHPRTAAALLFPRVLIVDDDLQLLEALQELLYLNGVSAIQSISTKQALEFAHLFLPEIALIDLRLGNEDGRDTAKLLLETFPHIHIIFMTGYADSLHVIEHEGKFPVLKKPFAIDSLIALIGNKVSQ